MEGSESTWSHVLQLTVKSFAPAAFFKFKLTMEDIKRKSGGKTCDLLIRDLVKGIRKRMAHQIYILSFHTEPHLIHLQTGISKHVGQTPIRPGSVISTSQITANLRSKVIVPFHRESNRSVMKTHYLAEVTWLGMAVLGTESRLSEFRTHILHRYTILQYFLRGIACLKGTTYIEVLESGPASNSRIHLPIRLRRCQLSRTRLWPHFPHCTREHVS